MSADIDVAAMEDLCRIVLLDTELESSADELYDWVMAHVTNGHSGFLALWSVVGITSNTMAIALQRRIPGAEVVAAAPVIADDCPPAEATVGRMLAASLRGDKDMLGDMVTAVVNQVSETDGALWWDLVFIEAARSLRGALLGLTS